MPRPKRKVARNRASNSGRPAGGVAEVSWAMVQNLPDEGTVTEFAAALQIDRVNLWRWITRHGAPVLNFPNIPDRNTPYRIAKPDFVAWLIETDRYRPLLQYR